MAITAHSGRRTIIGMLHLAALPGTPFHAQDLEETQARAVKGAAALAEGGAAGCLVQTVDRVYSTGNEADPARVASVAHIVRAIRQATPEHFQIGVMIMRNAISASLAVAKFSGGSFVRAGALVGATLSADGIVHADPHAVQHYRAQIRAQDIDIIAEIDSVHFKWLGAPRPVAEIAQLAQYVGASAVSLADPDPAVTAGLIDQVRQGTPKMPVFLASFTNHDNAADLLRNAHGAFVGTCLESGGWGGEIDVERVRAYMDIVNRLPPL